MKNILHRNNNFIGYLQSFRGFAILNIVAIHTFGLAVMISSEGSNPLNPISVINGLLFHNSTIYFAIISGMLFTAVLKRKGYRYFFLNKLKYIFLPYVFFTFFYTVFDNNSQEWFDLQPNIHTYLTEVLRNFLYGKASFVFWYIPVLFFLYLVTPILDYTMNQKRLGIYIITIVIALPLIIRRMEVDELLSRDFLSIQTMIYYTGAYAFGMFVADNLDERMNWISQNMRIFIAVAVVMTIGLLFITIQSIDRFGFFSLRSTLFYIQKIALSGIVLSFLKSLGEHQPGWLSPIANSAFTVYFAHIFFLSISIIPFISFFKSEKIYPFNVLGGGFLLLVTSILLSMLMVWIFKRIFGRYSKMIIGS